MGSGRSLRRSVSPIEGYCRPLSARPGESVSFHLSHDGEGVASIQRHTSTSMTVDSSEVRSMAYTAEHQVAPTTAWRDGCGWTETFSLTVQPEWTSGICSAACTDSAGGRCDITFVVKPGDDRRSPIAVLANVNTWLAYNGWGSRSRYSGAARTGFLRPMPRSAPEPGHPPHPRRAVGPRVAGEPGPHPRRLHRHRLPRRRLRPGAVPAPGREHAPRVLDAADVRPADVLPRRRREPRLPRWQRRVRDRGVRRRPDAGHDRHHPRAADRRPRAGPPPPHRGGRRRAGRRGRHVPAVHLRAGPGARAGRTGGRRPRGVRTGRRGRRRPRTACNGGRSRQEASCSATCPRRPTTSAW
jgi:hypothetical protein